MDGKDKLINHRVHTEKYISPPKGFQAGVIDLKLSHSIVLLLSRCSENMAQNTHNG